MIGSGLFFIPSAMRVLPIVMLLGAPSLAYRVPTLSPSRMAARTMCQRSGARALRELSHTRLFMTAAGSSSMISEKPDWDQGRGGDATADARDAHLQTAKLALLSAVSGLVLICARCDERSACAS